MKLRVEQVCFLKMLILSICFVRGKTSHYSIICTIPHIFGISCLVLLYINVIIYFRMIVVYVHVVIHLLICLFMFLYKFYH